LTEIILTEKDSLRLIREKLLQINATNLLDQGVLNQSNQQHINHYSREEVSSAILLLEDKLTLNPEDLTILDTLQSLYFKIQDHDSAYNYASKILELDPDNRDAYIIRCAVFYQWGSYQDALEELERAIELSQESTDTVDKITQHFQKDPNNENILLVSVPENLKQLIAFRDRILQRMHTSMVGMYG